MAEERIQTNCVKSNLLFTWLFRHLNRLSKPKLCEIPKDLQLEDSFDSLKNYWHEEATSNKPSFARSLIKVIWKDYCMSSIIQIVGNVQGLFMAVILKEMIDYLQGSTTDLTKENFLIAGLVLISFITITLKGNAEYRLLLLTGKIKCLITQIIAQKALKTNKNFINEGKILNLISGDLEIFDLLLYSPYLIGTPITLIVACLLIVYFFDKSGLIGIAISILHVPLIFVLAGIGSSFKGKCDDLSDRRIKLINNLIEGIKIFKFYAWENLLADKICEIRGKEMKLRYKSGYMTSLMTIFSMGGVCLCIFVTFYVYLTWIKKPLTLGEIYLIINIYISTHVSIVHLNIVSIYTFFVIRSVLKRITEILILPECAEVLDSAENTKPFIRLTDASFTKFPTISKHLMTVESLLEETSPRSILYNFSFELTQGKLLIIIGSIGSGKSVLLQALQKEYSLSEGTLIVNGKLSYASEVPWIVSGSVKDNILMGLNFVQERYFRVIQSCALDKDFENFIYGDETWIGERGITLSGGQKTRVNLARALYRDFDFLLLDDPLSSVDAQVANHIFNQCILSQLKEGKSVVLATHQLQFLSQANKILVIENGTQVFYGKFSELEKNEEVLSSIQLMQGLTDQEVVEVQLWAQENHINLDEEEILEKLKVKNVWRYLIQGFGNWIFMVVGILGIVATMVVYQELIYWCSHREKLDDKSDEYFLYGLGMWTLAFYLTLAAAALYLSTFFTRCNHGIHNKSLKSIACAQSVFFDNNPSGRMLNRFSRDISNCDGPLNYYLFDSLSYLGFLWGSIVVQLIVIPYITLVVPFYLCVLALMFYYTSSIISKLRKKEYISKSPILSYMASALEGLTTIRTQKLEPKVMADLFIQINEYYRCFITNQSFMRFTQLYSEIFGLIIVAINVILIIKSDNLIEVGLAAYSLSSSINIISTSSIATKDLLELNSLMFSPQHLLEYFDLNQEKVDSLKNFIISSGKIEFQRINFKYQPHLPTVLNDISFIINPGEKVGIVGRTGSGKSSLLHVLCRLTEPLSGTILVDEQDYKMFGLHNLRSQISVIPQNSVLFSTSLRDNLDPVRLFNDDQIWKVLEMVKLSGLFLGSENGLDSLIGSEGIKLSAGQKQLVCIARSILSKNKIVVLDEATSNIDVKTDEFIQKILKTQFQDSTLILIAHRILTAADSDRILVMDSGHCVEFDEPCRLFDIEKGVFRKLAVTAGLKREHFIRS